jgi:hypothetical protein
MKVSQAFIEVALHDLEFCWERVLEDLQNLLFILRNEKDYSVG